MKKTLNINIGNSIIHIEEDAYELLKVYLNDIKAHFVRNQDDFEIVTDIENRIAEMFRDMLFTQQKQAISIEDVEEVKAQMGSVSDFETLDEEESFTSAPYTSTVKKLYRDTEKGMVAGVCAGLSHYLNVEERWVRLFFLIFLFIGGASFLVYLVMWIIVPRALTRSEKMHMKGEPVNLQGFIRNFQEEMETNQLMQRSGGIIKEIIAVIGKFFNSFGKLIFKLSAGLIIFFSACSLLSLMVSLALFLGVYDGSASDLFPFNIVNGAYLKPLLFALFVSFAVPLLALILFAVRVAFRSAPINKSISFSLLSLWLLGSAFSVYFGARVSSEFKEEAEITEVTNVQPYPVYRLELNRDRFFSSADSVKYDLKSQKHNGRIIVDDHDGPFTTPSRVRINIEKTPNKAVSVVKNLSSQGRTFDNALKHARNIRYDFAQQDSVLTFSPRWYLEKNVNWRNQEVVVTVKVPVGTKLILNKDLDRYMWSYGSWACDDESEGERDYTEWIMTEDGLQCLHKKENGAQQ